MSAPPLCLIKCGQLRVEESEVTAVVKTPTGDVNATPYKSSGTSYSKFAVISLGNNTFSVTRIVN